MCPAAGQIDLDIPQLTVNAALAFIDGRLVPTGTTTNRSRILHLDAATAAATARHPGRLGNDPDLMFT